MVTITYGHGHLEDCTDTTSWVEAVNNIAGGDASMTAIYGDVFDLSAVFDDANDEYAYYQKNITNFSATAYPYYVVRWKTTDSATSGAGLCVDVIYDDASYDRIVGVKFPAAPEFSSTWHVTTGTLAPSGSSTVDWLRFVIDDDPSAFAGGTRHAYVDFILFCKGVFTIPNVDFGMRWNPGVRDAFLGVPGRVTDITQRMGSESATCTIGCDLDQDTWTATGYANYAGEIFDYIAHESHSEPWQWVTGLDQRSMKATVHPTFNYEGQARRLDLELREYSLMDKSYDTHAERWNIT